METTTKQLNTPSHYRFYYTLRVRFAETDMQGIVFNGNYLTYYDVAWTEYFRHLGFGPQQITELAVDSVLVKTTLNYKSVSRFDDELKIYARVSELKNTSMTLDFAIYLNDVLVNTASSVYVWIDPKTMKSTPIPTPIRNAIEKFETGFVTIARRVRK